MASEDHDLLLRIDERQRTMVGQLVGIDAKVTGMQGGYDGLRERVAANEADIRSTRRLVRWLAGGFLSLIGLGGASKWL